MNSQFAGSGLNANDASTVSIYGGSFIGGNGAQIPTGNGSPGDGVIGLGGNVDIHGGTFTGGTGGYGIDVFIGNITLYGTFTVNGMADFTGEIPTGDGTITGFFDDSTTEETFTYRQLGEGGTLTIVPEPAEWLGGSLLTGCLVVWIVRRARVSAL